MFSQFGCFKRVSDAPISYLVLQIRANKFVYVIIIVICVAVLCFLTVGIIMAEGCLKDEISEAVLKVSKGSSQFTTNVYKVSVGSLNYGDVEGCGKPCSYVLSIIYDFYVFYSG